MEAVKLSPKDRIILALDVYTLQKAIELVEELHPYVGAFKVGNELFTSQGPKVIQAIEENNARIFLDLKYHDIPETVSKASLIAATLGVYMFNVHASGGLAMMKAAADAVKKKAEELGKSRTLVLGVTMLTSIDQPTMNDELSIHGSVAEHVTHLAKLAKEAGLDGVVCSPHEIAAVRKECGKSFVIVCPGVRPSWSHGNDQKRIMTPKEALAAGADFLVIGRPITQQKDRVAAAKRIIDEMG